MRDILFKAKRMDNEEWVQGNVFFADNGKCEICIGTPIVRITYEVNPETVCQYTGLTDKNGVKIFEGDKLSVSKGEPYEKNGFAKIVSACWIIEFSDSWDFLDNVKIVSEVVGNIHDKE